MVNTFTSEMLFILSLVCSVIINVKSSCKRKQSKYAWKTWSGDLLHYINNSLPYNRQRNKAEISYLFLFMSCMARWTFSHCLQSNEWELTSRQDMKHSTKKKSQLPGYKQETDIPAQKSFFLAAVNTKIHAFLQSLNFTAAKSYPLKDSRCFCLIFRMFWRYS